MYLEHDINIFTSYANIMQLPCKDKKLKTVVEPKPKKWDSYKIPVINLNTKDLDIEPLK